MSAVATRVIDEMRDWSVMRIETQVSVGGRAPRDNAWRATHGLDDCTRAAVVRWAVERGYAALCAAAADADLEAVLSGSLS